MHTGFLFSVTLCLSSIIPSSPACYYPAPIPFLAFFLAAQERWQGRNKRQRQQEEEGIGVFNPLEY